MDIKDKIVDALLAALKARYVRLEDDDGISGFVVSSQFEGVSALDRQALIDKALSNGPEPLTQDERNRILMIAALTPVEYEAVGARIRVQEVREKAGGALEVLLQGGLSDAEYVRGALKSQKGVQTTQPQAVSGRRGVLMSFRAKGTDASPLTKAHALRVLKKDPYIEVMPKV